MEKDRKEDYNKIIELPMIECENIFEDEIKEVSKMQFDNEYYKLIIQKLVNEKDIWPKYRHL
jgi:hypothetical protein